MKSIVRKFLIKDIPDISKLNKTNLIRFYVHISKQSVIRIQKRNDKYELERKIHLSNTVRDEVKLEITKGEFESLKKMSQQKIIREGYTFSEKPLIKLVVYQGQFKGLKRVEVAFDSLANAKKFNPPDWFGEDITDTLLAQDAKLLSLPKGKFNNLLKKYLQ